MKCTHLAIYRAAPGRHVCRDCGAAVAVAEPGVAVAGRVQAVDQLVAASTRFVEATRRRRSDLYYQAFRTLDAAVNDLYERGGDDRVPGPSGSVG